MTIDERAKAIAHWWECETGEGGEAAHAAKIAEAIREAVWAEREACAKIFDDHAAEFFEIARELGRWKIAAVEADRCRRRAAEMTDIAATIRARP